MQDEATPKRSYHHGSLKEALVAAGIEILDARGLEALSLRAIAAHVGDKNDREYENRVSLSF